MNIAHFVAATIGRKSTPKKCTVLSAAQIDFFPQALPKKPKKAKTEEKPTSVVSDRDIDNDPNGDQ
jgi:hypothetical protein